MDKYQITFCLLKPEAYLTGKNKFIEKRIIESGFKISERWKVRLALGDVFKLYDRWIPRITSIIRFYPLFKVDMYILEGVDAINSIYNLKHKIRYQIWGWDYKKGGFLHTPDSLEEARTHIEIISNRIVEVIPVDGHPYPSI